MDVQAERIVAACRESGAREVRTAADEAERQLLWKGRKSAFGAYGRVSPAYMVMDGVIPRTKLPYVLGRVNEIVAAHGLRVGNVFHAGDGNLHPNILYDPRKPGEEARVVEAGAADHEGLRRGRWLDLRRARHRAREGRLHAVHLLAGRPGLHAAAQERLQSRPASAIPARSSRPGSPAARPGRSPTGRTRSKRRASPSASERGRIAAVQPALLDKLRAIVGAAHVLTGVELSPYVVEGRTPEAAVFPGSVDEVRARSSLGRRGRRPDHAVGRRHRRRPSATPPPRAGIVLGLRRLDRARRARAGRPHGDRPRPGITVDGLQDDAAGARASGSRSTRPTPSAATVGGVIAANASGPRRHLYGTARDLLIGVTVVTADGDVVRGGGKVVKNVAGYDLPKLFVGSLRHARRHRRRRPFKLRPRPDDERLSPCASIA